MSSALMAVQLYAFGVIGLLPLTFFRRGRANARWLATALPLFVAPAALVWGSLAGVTPWLDPASTTGVVATVASAVVSLTGIFLIGLTLGTHQRRLALWHQADDAPVELVDRGPYAMVRHPFYSAFLLILTGAFLAQPDPTLLATLAYGALVLGWTARREEQRFLASDLGAAYRDYMARTGRFLPGLGMGGLV